MKGKAVFGGGYERPYRYFLKRTWGWDGYRILWIMLNPSTADAKKDDNTIRRCISFSKREGCTTMYVVNLFALRATNPKKLLKHVDPVGKKNKKWLRYALEDADRIVVAWGKLDKKLLNVYAFEADIKHLIKKVSREFYLYCLGTTSDGSPRHPLYVSKKQPLKVWKCNL